MLDTAFVEGRRVATDGPVRTFVDPATGKPAEEGRDATPATVDVAVEAARRALAGDWGGSTPAERSDVLRRLADLVESRIDELAAVEVSETGKPLTTVRDGELPFAVDNLRFFAGAARSLAGTGTGRLTRGYTSLLTRSPVGVVGAIAPWNFPIVMAVWKAGPAIAAGCSVVLKPAPATPRGTLLFAELASQAGMPDGVLNVVSGGDDVGEAIVAHPDVAMISLTGSTETGRRVMADAAPTLKRLHLELGGKAPAIVLDDADVQQAAAAITLGATYNTGQDCTAATRVYVDRRRSSEAIEAIAEAMRSVRSGDPRDPDTHIGPLISRQHRERVHGYVQGAQSEGARIVVGGQVPDGPGFFYPPTLVAEVDQAARIVQEEIFGPVLVVLPVDGDAEAFRLANDVRYGLASSVWTTDGARALRAAEQLEFGVVWVNDHLPIASEAPHGGVKQSGFGSDLSEDSVLAYSVPRHVMIKHAAPAGRNGFRPA